MRPWDKRLPFYRNEQHTFKATNIQHLGYEDRTNPILGEMRQFSFTFLGEAQEKNTHKKKKPTKEKAQDLTQDFPHQAESKTQEQDEPAHQLHQFSPCVTHERSPEGQQDRKGYERAKCGECGSENHWDKMEWLYSTTAVW